MSKPTTPVGAARATRRVIALFAVAFAVVAGAVFAFAPTRAPATGHPQVAATIFPLYDLVRTVAGPEFDVALILPPGAEPHSFEPQPSTVRDVAASGVVFAIGHGVDDWVDAVAGSTGTAKFVVDGGISLRKPAGVIALGESEYVGEWNATGESALGVENPHTLDDGHGHATEDVDPHYWLSPANATVMIINIRDELVRRYPDRADGFTSRAADLETRIYKLHRDLQAQLGARANKDIVTFHDAWYYFADTYGLRIVGTFEPSPGREPSPQALATLRQTVRGAGVKTLFTEPLFSDDAIESFARDEGLAIVPIDDIGGFSGRDTYESLMRFNAEAIAQSQ